MTHINSAAALNSVNLLAIILLQTEQKALSQSQTICQLNFYLQLFKDAKYSDTISMPNKTAQELLNHALTLGKFELVDDIVAINDKEVILLNYYRNNIIHLFAVPSLLALHIIRARTTNVVDCIEKVKTLYPLFAAEWFMSPLDEQYITSVVTAFAEQGLISLDANNNISISQSSSSYFMLDLLGRVLDCTLQRYAVVIGLLTEQSSHLLAARLSKLHGINTPEFYDQKVLTGLIAGLKDLNLVELNEQNQLISTEQLQHTSAVLSLC
jgi:glycerol-3-phosphate O-acyltransferase